MKSSKFEQFDDRNKLFEIKEIDFAIENEQISFAFITSIFAKRFDEKTFKF